MKLSSVLLAILAVTCMGVCAPLTASAETAAEKNPNYVLLKGGIYTPSSSHDVDNINAGSTTHFDKTTGFSGEIAAGHYFMPMLALEFGAGYFERKGSPDALPGETKLKVIPLVATGKALLPLGLIEPYGLFGIGAYVTEFSGKGDTVHIGDSTKVTYGLHCGVGLNININDAFFVGAEGKYVWVKPSFGGQDIKLDGFITTADLGIRF